MTINRALAEKIQSIIRDRANLIECANRCAKAYADAYDYPYSPFGEDYPEIVAQNYAGLQAVVAGVFLLCHPISGADYYDDAYGILKKIVDNEVNIYERQILHRFANATWGAGQPFRTDKEPLGRADRVNVFDLLPPEEVEKDWVQIRTAATFLLEKLNKN